MQLTHPHPELAGEPGISPARRWVTLPGAHSHSQRQEARTAASLLTTLQFTLNQNVAPPASHPPPHITNSPFIQAFPRHESLSVTECCLGSSWNINITSVHRRALTLCCSLYDWSRSGRNIITLFKVAKFRIVLPIFHEIFAQIF